MRYIILLFFISSSVAGLCQQCCDTYPVDYTPKDLTDALNYLDCKWSKKDKRQFRKKEEQDAVTMLHMGTGLGIRNNWGLWKGGNELVKYFNSIGVYHPDDMSSIITTSFHRKLNNKSLKLEEQAEYYKQYWNPVIEAALNSEKVGEALFQEYNAGDTVQLFFAKETLNANIILLGRGSDKVKDCTVTGVIKDKRIQYRDEDNTVPLPPLNHYFLEIEILYICDNIEEALYESFIPVKKGDTFSYYSSCCEIEKK